MSNDHDKLCSWKFGKGRSYRRFDVAERFEDFRDLPPVTFVPKNDEVQALLDKLEPVCTLEFEDRTFHLALGGWIREGSV